MNDTQNSCIEKCIEQSVPGFPGISERLYWSNKHQKHLPPEMVKGCKALRYRAMVRVKRAGVWSKEQKMFATLKEACFWLQTCDVTESTTSVVPVQQPVQQYTMKDLIDDWLAWTRIHLVPSSVQLYEKDVEHMQPLYGIPVESLQAEDLDAWLKLLIDPSYPKPKSRTSFEREMESLRAVLNWYRERKNPRYQHPVLRRHRTDSFFLKRPKQKKMPLTVEQLEDVLDHMKKRCKTVYYYLAAFQSLCGARIGEACGLKWSDIDFVNRRVTFQRVVWWDRKTKEPNLREGTKTNEIRVVKLCERLIDLLKEWQAIAPEGEFVFLNEGKFLRYNAIQNAYNGVFKTLGLPHRSTHVFRHTFATIHADQTKDIRATQGALGHRDLRTTQHYANVSERTQENALSEFALGKSKSSESNPTPNGAGTVIPLFERKVG